MPAMIFLQSKGIGLLYWLHIPVVQGAGSVGTSKRLDLDEKEKERGREGQKRRKGGRKAERGWSEERRRQKLRRKSSEK